MQSSPERWVPVVGHEDAYQVSDKGRVRSVDREVAGCGGSSRTVKGRILRPGTHRNGYLYVNLCQAGKQSSKYVHRLVLESHVGTCPEGMEACHFDDDKTNNALANLRWGSKSENRLDSVRNGSHLHSRKNQCPHGHGYTVTNTALYSRVDGGVARHCRECRREHSRKHRARVRQ